jgi:hypothetical protein
MKTTKKIELGIFLVSSLVFLTGSILSHSILGGIGVLMLGTFLFYKSIAVRKFNKAMFEKNGLLGSIITIFGGVFYMSVSVFIYNAIFIMAERNRDWYYYDLQKSWSEMSFLGKLWNTGSPVWSLLIFFSIAIGFMFLFSIFRDKKEAC